MARKPRITKSAADLILPQNDTEARVMIARLGTAQRRAAAQTELVRAEIEKLKSDLKSFLDVIDGEARLLHKALQAYFTAHAERLTEGGKRRTVDWPEGQMGHRLSKPKVKLLLEEALVIDFLDTRQLDEMLRVKTEIDRNALLAALQDGIPEVLDLAEIDQREEFFVAPDAPDAPPALEVAA